MTLNELAKKALYDVSFSNKEEYNVEIFKKYLRMYAVEVLTDIHILTEDFSAPETELIVEHYLKELNDAIK